jgi:hypothetical protein
MPIILAIQEAKIRRIKFRGQPRKLVHEILSQKCPTQIKTGGMASGRVPA